MAGLRRTLKTSRSKELRLRGRSQLLWAISLGALLGARPARADHCQPSAPTETSEHGGVAERVSLAYEAASFANPSYEGSYEGVRAGYDLGVGRFALRLEVPAYLLTRNGLTDSGLGDVFGEAHWSFFAPASSPWRAGAALALSAPTGDAGAELGMGHFMAFGAGVLEYFRDDFVFSARLGYAGALADASAHLHHQLGRSPLVNPMNMQELQASLVSSFEVAPHVRLRGSAYVAAPVIEAGLVRSAAALAFDFIWRRFDSSIEGQLPLAGDPFTAKLITSLGVRF
jgi:hypothetical protein